MVVQPPLLFLTGALHLPVRHLSISNWFQSRLLRITSRYPLYTLLARNIENLSSSSRSNQPPMKSIDDLLTEFGEISLEDSDNAKKAPKDYTAGMAKLHALLTNGMYQSCITLEPQYSTLHQWSTTPPGIATSEMQSIGRPFRASRLQLHQRFSANLTTKMSTSSHS